MNKINWSTIAGLVVLLAVFLAGVSFLGGGGWYGNWGMMGPGMMGWGFGPLGWIVLPLLWLGAVVLVLLGFISFAGALLRGTKPKYCPSCGCEAMTGARYCWHCGKPLPTK